MRKNRTRPRMKSLCRRLGLGCLVFGLGGGLAAQSVDLSRFSSIVVADAKPILPLERPVIDLRFLESLETAEGVNGRNAAPDLHPLLQAIQEESERANMLERELYRQLKEALPGGGEGVTFDGLKLPMNFKPPLGSWSVDFVFRLPQRGVGTVVYTGTIEQRNRTIQRIGGSIMIDRMATGVQVRRLVRRGERIRPDDLATLSTRLSLLPADAYTHHELLSGTAARSELRPGMWITGRMLKMPQAIRARQAVTMRLVNGGIRIVTKGIAKQNGSIGEIIRVQNINSKKEVLARVVSHDEVEVLF